MSARLVARCCAAGGAVGLALMAGPAWAVDLPSLPSAPAAAPTLPALLPSPSPTELLPSPVASALGPVLTQLPGSTPPSSPAAKPVPRPAPKPKPVTRSDRQAALAETGIAALPATVALRAGTGVGTGTAALQAFPGINVPMTVQPQPVVPRLTPVATTAIGQSPASAPADGGLPAIVVALAIGAVSAVAAGQLAAMAEGRRLT